ncbi:MAG: GNAT family N-acetyltransferase [Terrisporobacter sp.]
MEGVVIETDRLILRNINQNDYLEIANILQDINVMYAWEKSFSHDEVQMWIDENLKRYNNEGYSYFLALNKENNTVVGVIGPLIEKIKGKSYIGVAYILNKKSWGKGYA